MATSMPKLQNAAQREKLNQAVGEGSRGSLWLPPGKPSNPFEEPPAQHSPLGSVRGSSLQPREKCSEPENLGSSSKKIQVREAVTSKLSRSVGLISISF